MKGTMEEKPVCPEPFIKKQHSEEQQNDRALAGKGWGTGNGSYIVLFYFGLGIFECIMLNGKSQTQKVTQCTIPFIM